MNSDVNFVNKFMDSMRNKLNDFVGQVVMLETHNALANERCDLLDAAVKELEQKIEQKDADYSLLVGEKEKLQKQIDSQTADLEKIGKDLDSYVNIANEAIEKLNNIHAEVKNEYQSQIDSLQSQLNTAQHEHNSCQRRESELANDYRKLDALRNQLQTDLAASRKAESEVVSDYQELLRAYEVLQKENAELKKPVVDPKPTPKKINTTK